MHLFCSILSFLIAQHVNAETSIFEQRFKEFLMSASDAPLFHKHPKCLDSPHLRYVALGPCRSTYLDCTKINSRQTCLFPGHVFNEAEQQCKSRLVSHECAYNHVTYLSKGRRTLNRFCNLRPNGKYRHPDHCDKIIHCFDNLMIEIEPCIDGLAFDEYLNRCVYAQLVPGCEIKSVQMCNPSDTMQTDCHSYERCFAGQRIRMHCDNGLTYNAISMVCDYEKNVPNCTTK